jgi:hypothetical protein
MRELTRRHLFGTGAAGLTAGGAFASDSAVAPEEDRAGGNPAFYRTRLGGAEITIVSNGTIGFPPPLVLPEVPEAERQDFLAARYQPQDRVPLQLNAMVVDLNGRRVPGRASATSRGRATPSAGSRRSGAGSISCARACHQRPSADRRQRRDRSARDLGLPRCTAAA